MPASTLEGLHSQAIGVVALAAISAVHLGLARSDQTRLSCFHARRMVTHPLSFAR